MLTAGEVDSFIADGFVAIRGAVPSDVFLCHPLLVHAATWPHRGTRPRMVAQPAVALHGQFPLTAPLSPVEQVISAAGQSQSSAGSY